MPPDDSPSSSSSGTYFSERSGLSAGEKVNAAPPRIFGYECDACIGAGGMGTVWRARQLSTRRVVALKVLRGVVRDSSTAKLRFEREVEAAGRLDHPNIAHVYDSGVSGEVFFFAMQFVDGCPLSDYVSASKLDRRGILKLIGVVCRAIQYAHQRGVIHRDLKKIPDERYYADRRASWHASLYES
jgi:eukaryotic-like serine/threonine-protein kinase